jgi:transposase
VGAAWAAARVPGLIRVFFLRIQIRRGKAVAAVAAGRELAVLVRHLLSHEKEHAWVRPALLGAKLGKMEFAAGCPVAQGRRQEANWQTKSPEGHTGAASGKRTS